MGGPPHMDFDLADWVLGKPKGRELEAVQSAIGEAAQAVELVITAGIEAAQEKFN